MKDPNLIPVEEYAKQKGLSSDQVIQQIREGSLAGKIDQQQWYVELLLSNKMQSVTDKSKTEGQMPISKIIFSCQGRIPRKTFWLFGVSVRAVIIVLSFIIGGISGNEGAAGITLVLGLLLYCYPSIAIEVKRWHDRGKSGWMVLINLIPIIGILWVLVELGFLQGLTGPNQYGDDPLQTTG